MSKLLEAPSRGIDLQDMAGVRGRMGLSLFSIFLLYLPYDYSYFDYQKIAFEILYKTIYG
jgi:hypothetical protein